MICLKGHLDPGWSEWFGGLVLTCTDSGDTILSGRLTDQAALHSVLARVRDLNLTLISLSRIERGHAPLEGRETSHTTAAESESMGNPRTA